VAKAAKVTKGGKNKSKGSGGKKKKNAEQDYRKKYKTEVKKYYIGAVTDSFCVVLQVLGGKGFL